MAKYNVADITKHMGERLVMFYLMKYLDWEVDYVDYVGADLIAIEKSTQHKFAISVKTKNHETDGHSCSLFTHGDARKLKEFASEISTDDECVVPLVAFVIIKLDGTVCVFVANLKDLEEMAEENLIFEKKENNYLFVYGNQNNPKNCKTEKGYNDNLKKDREIFENVLKERRITHIIDNPKDVYVGNLYGAWDWKEYCLEKEMHNAHQGDFGEQYIAWYAEKYGMRSFVVKTEGVDVVLQNKLTKEMYAVSVKTFSKDQDAGYEFEKGNIDKLNDYATKWGMKPIVSLLFVVEEEEKTKVYNLNIPLTYLEECASDSNNKLINYCKGKNNYGGIRLKKHLEVFEKMSTDSKVRVSQIEII